jgi:molybdenum cofactor biosynthesis enzyme MoaA
MLRRNTENEQLVDVGPLSIGGWFNLILRILGRSDCPVYLIHHVTRECDLSCKHCFVPTAPFKGDPLTISEIELIARSIPWLLALNITGGEPLLRPDLAEIVGVYRKYCNVKFVQVTTAGQRPKETMDFVEDVLLKYGQFYLSLQLSIDGPEQVHDRLRGKHGSFRKAMETLELLVSQKKSLAALDPVVNITIGNQESESLLEFVRSLRNSFPNVPIVYTLVRDQPVKPDLAVAKRLLKTLEKIQVDRRSRLGGLLTAKDQLVRKISLGIASGQSIGGTCTAGIHSGVLWADGTLSACESRFGSSANLRNLGYNLPHAWQSDIISAERSKIATTGCTCTHECFWTTNILFRKQYYPSLVGQWLKQKLRTT